MTQGAPLDYATPLPTPPRRIRLTGGLLGWLIFVAFVALVFTWLKQSTPGVPAVPLSTFFAEVKSHNLTSVEIDGDEIAGKFAAPITFGGARVYRFRTELPAGTGGNWAFTQWLLENSPATDVRAMPTNGVLNNFILPLVPWVMILAFIWFFVFRQLRNRGTKPMQVVLVNPEAR